VNTKVAINQSVAMMIQRTRSQVIPRVVDRTSGQFSLVVDGQWLTADEWLSGTALATRLRCKLSTFYRAAEVLSK
jgi:hypothetical protein